MKRTRWRRRAARRPARRQPFGRKLVSFEGDGKSMGNSTFSRNPWEHAKKMEAFYGHTSTAKSLLPP